MRAKVEQSFWALCQHFKSQCRCHLFALLALVLGAWALTSVPQVSNLWMQMPPVEWRFLGMCSEYLVFVAALFGFYLPSLLVVVPWHIPHGRILPLGLGRVGKVVFFPAAAASCWIGILNHRLNNIARIILGFLLLAIGGAMLLFGSPAYGIPPYPLMGAFLQSSAFILVLMGILLVVCAVYPRTLLQPAQTNVWKAAARCLSWYIAGNVIGECIWVLAGYAFHDVSYRTYSIWALLHTLSSLVVIGSLVDFWHVYSAFPARQFAVVVVVALLWLQGPEVVQDAEQSAVQQLTLAATQAAAPEEKPKDWYQHALDRLEAMPTGPAVIVVPSGGGSRAAIFTMLVLDCMARAPMGIASIDDPPPHTHLDATASTSPVHMWSDNIFLISSVSGGSLAAATFVTQPNRRTSQRDFQNTSREELVYWTVKHLDEVKQDRDGLLSITLARIESLRKGPGLAAVERRRLEDDEKRLRKELENLETSRTSLLNDGGTKARIAWVFKDELADEMCIDFMAPILRGSFSPSVSRGDALAHFWKQRFGWSGINRSNWADEAKSKPLVILNATDVDDGARLGIGLPPLPNDIFDRRVDPVEPRTDRLPREFGEFNPKAVCPLGLARAVRLSSNFPWGFPIASFNNKSNPATEKGLRVLDGGVIDNTGIDTVYFLIKGIERVASDPKNVAQTNASKLLDKLRQKGVVFIEIDSGAKPLPEQEEALASVRGPLNALNNALYSNADMTREYYKSELKGLLAAEPDAEPPAGIDTQRARQVIKSIKSEFIPSVFWQTFQCNHSKNLKANVMTAWALGPKDKAIVFGEFLTNWEDWNDFANTLPEKVEKAKQDLNDQRLAARKILIEESITRARATLESTQRLLANLKKNGTLELFLRFAEDARNNLPRQSEVLAMVDKYAQTYPKDGRYAKRYAAELLPLRQKIVLLKSQIDSTVLALANAKDAGDDTLYHAVAKASEVAESALPSQRDVQSTMRSFTDAGRQLTSMQEFQSAVDKRVAQTKRFYEQARGEAASPPSSQAPQLSNTAADGSK